MPPTRTERSERRRKTHKPATLIRPAAGAAPADVECPEALYEQALQELGITVPVATCRLVNNRLEFRLYGGRVVYWPPLELRLEEASPAEPGCLNPSLPPSSSGEEEDLC